MACHTGATIGDYNGSEDGYKTRRERVCEAYRYFGEKFRQVFGTEGKEGKRMRGKTSCKPQQGGECGSGAKEVRPL